MDTPPLTEAQSDALRAFLDKSMHVILDSEDSQAYLRWVGEQFPSVAEDLESQAGTIMYWLARSLWNATPLPSHGFRPQPLPEPGRNDPCPCGSGRKFKRCCASAGIAEDADPEVVMPIMLRHLSPAQRKKAVKQAPTSFKITMAEHELVERHPGRARDLLLTMLESPPRNELEHAIIIELLSQSYADLGHHKAALTRGR